MAVFGGRAVIVAGTNDMHPEAGSLVNWLQDIRPLYGLAFQRFGARADNTRRARQSGPHEEFLGPWLVHGDCGASTPEWV